jgi:hypothetical protein
MWQRAEHTLFVARMLINPVVVDVSDAPLYEKHNDLQKELLEIFLLKYNFLFILVYKYIFIQQ